MLYYRLHQVDWDGAASYSPVRVVTRAVQTSLALFPNPASRLATLAGVLPGTLVRVFDALGREVTSATTDTGGTATLVLPYGLPRGMYVVRAGLAARCLLVE
jgi:hypothetical protein